MGEGVEAEEDGQQGGGAEVDGGKGQGFGAVEAVELAEAEDDGKLPGADAAV